jgi:hypothetical protein
MNLYSATGQPEPISNSQVAVWQVVISDIQTLPDSPTKTALLTDMHDRDTFGRSKYGVPLQPFNGRDALIDLYQEFLDATVYTKQYQLENPSDSSFALVYDILLSMLRNVREKLISRS